MDAHVLGPLRVLDDAGTAVRLPAGRARSLLALLLLRRGGVVGTRELSALWTDGAPTTMPKVVQNFVVGLRRVLPPTCQLETAPGGYRLTTPPGSLDADRFEASVTAGRLLLADRPAEALARLDEGLALWRGAAWPDLSDLPDLAEAAAEVGRLEELRLLAQDISADARLAEGDHAALVPRLRLAVSAEPFREHRRAQLVLALYRSGRQAEALDAWSDARRALREELGTDPGPELQRLQADVLDHHPALMRTGPERVRAGVLPRPPARMVGRDDLVERTASLLASGRLVTVTGPGGMGKTALALTVAHSWQQTGGEACFVDLAGMLGEAPVHHAAARALGLRDATFAGVVDALAARPGLLVVLDNAEHVVTGVSELCRAHQRQGGATLLVTSRERLRVEEEVVIALPPLDNEVAVGLLTDLALEAGVDLGYQTGGTTGSSGGRPAAGDGRNALVQLAERLDGLPLALRLAAGRLVTESPDEVLRSMVGVVAVGGPVERHRTMADAVRWSLELLTPAERAGFRRLAAMGSAAPREVAEAVIGLPDAAAVLGGLVERCLAVRVGQPGSPAVRLLVPIREVAVTLLAADPAEEHAARERHVAAYLRLGVDWRRRGDQWSPVAYADDVMAAVESAGQLGLPREGAELLAMLSRPDWVRTDELAAASGWLRDEARRQARLDPGAEALLLMIEARAHERMADFDLALRLARTVRPLVERIDHPALLAECLFVLAYSDPAYLSESREPADMERLEALLVQGIATWPGADRVGPTGLSRSWSHSLYGGWLRAVGRLPEAEEQWRQGWQESRACHDPEQDHYLVGLGNILRTAGDTAAAQDCFDLVLQGQAGPPHPRSLAGALLGNGMLALEQGDAGRSVTGLRQAIGIAREWHFHIILCHGVQLLGRAAAELGDPFTGVRLIAAGRALRGTSRSPAAIGGERFDTYLEGLRTTLGAVRFELAWDAGWGGNLNQTLAETGTG